MSDFFGETKNVEREAELKMKWPSRPVNQIELEILCEMVDALSLVEHRAPILFFEDDQWANADAYAEYGPLSAREAMTLRDIIETEVVERYRRQANAARDCGERATTQLYLLMCEAEGIDPLVRKETK